MTKKAGDTSTLEREIKLLQNRVKAETKEKEDLTARVASKTKEIDEIKRQMKIVQVNSEKVPTRRPRGFGAHPFGQQRGNPWARPCHRRDICTKQH